MEKVRRREQMGREKERDGGRKWSRKKGRV